MGSRARALAMFGLLNAIPLVALAQTKADAPAASSEAAPSAPSEAPASPNVTGHSYSDHAPSVITDSPRTASASRPARRVARLVAAPPDAPIATLDGFEMLGDGGSRVFVHVSKNVAVEERRTAQGITYVLKGAYVRKHNDTNPLVTLHWNTPVSSARLVPVGADLHFVLRLRAPASPTWKVVQSSDGVSILQIDFPRGDFLSNAVSSAAFAGSPRDGASGDDSGDSGAAALGDPPATKAPSGLKSKKKPPPSVSKPPPSP